MNITLNLTTAEENRISQFAKKKKCSVEELTLSALTDMFDREDAKDKRNAEYLAKIDRGIEQMKKGTGRFFTDEELEDFFNGSKL